MKAKQIKEGGCYQAKVNGQLTTVRVDDIVLTQSLWTSRIITRYDVTNLATGRKTTFRSAATFRSEVDQLPATAGR